MTIVSDAPIYDITFNCLSDDSRPVLQAKSNLHHGCNSNQHSDTQQSNKTPDTQYNNTQHAVLFYRMFVCRVSFVLCPFVLRVIFIVMLIVFLYWRIKLIRLCWLIRTTRMFQCLASMPQFPELAG
jgi:hypothetical protein